VVRRAPVPQVFFTYAAVKTRSWQLAYTWISIESKHAAVYEKDMAR
jgi:hypothetical protein